MIKIKKTWFTRKGRVQVYRHDFAIFIFCEVFKGLRKVRDATSHLQDSMRENAQYFLWNACTTTWTESCVCIVAAQNILCLMRTTSVELGKRKMSTMNILCVCVHIHLFANAGTVGKFDSAWITMRVWIPTSSTVHLETFHHFDSCFLLS